MNDKPDDEPEVAAATATATAVVVAENTTDDPPQEASSTATVCAWVAFILINGSFSALVAWGSSENWAAGFGLAIAYTIVLLVTGHLLKRRNSWKDSILTSLLFLLVVVAIAISGLYLPLNVVPCSGGNFYYDDYYENNSWITEIESLPMDVQSWWDNGYRSEYNPTSFVHFNNSGVTLFAGSPETYYGDGKYLWRIEDGGAPEMVEGISYPLEFIMLEDSTSCFFFRADGELRDESRVACTNDGVEIKETEEYFSYPGDFFYSNELIWFRADVPSGLEGWGQLLYSVDPFSLSEVSLYSSPPNENNEEPPGGPSDDECSSEQTNYIRFLSLLFLSALPSLIGAIVVGFVYKAPSMSVGGYLSMTWLVICLIFTIDPRFDDLPDFFGWWFVLTSGPWLILLTLAHLTNRTTKSRLAWGINFAALIYTTGMFLLLGVFDYYDQDMFWEWAVITIFVVPPLILMGVITRQIILTVVACVVIMIDLFRLIAYISDVTGFDDTFPIYFVVLGLSGLTLGFLGYLLNKRQSRIESAVSGWAKSSLARWVIDSDKE